MCTCAKCQPHCSALSLERWRILMQAQMNPFHFYQMANRALSMKRECSTLVHEHLFQSGGKTIGRQEIRDAIVRAEGMLAEQLGYWPAPTWQCEDVSLRHARGNRFRLDATKIDVIGKETLTYLDDYTVTMVDLDQDGVNEAFQLEFLAADLPVNARIDEISAYFTETDRVVVGKPFCEYEIRPIQVQQVGELIRVTGSAWLIVRPVLYEGFAPRTSNAVYSLDIDLVDNYATALSIYVKGIDHCAAGNGIWQATRGCSCQTAGQTCPPSCAHCEAMDFCLEDGDLGVVRMVQAYCSCGGRPDQVSVSFRAGDCLANWELIIARLAAAELANGACDCGDASIDYWREDLAIVKNEKGIVSYDRDILHNPWGTRRGHIYAWERVRDKRNLFAALV